MWHYQYQEVLVIAEILVITRIILYRFLSRHQYHLVIVNVVINSVSSIRLKVLVTADVTSILLRMNEIVDAANISQLNSNAPAVFPMGVRLGTLLQCSCCSRCL